MLGIITLLIAAAAQMGYTIFCLIKKEVQPFVKHTMRISAFLLLSLLLLLHVYEWGFRWYALFLLLAVLTIFSIVYFVRKPQNNRRFRKSYAIFSCIIGILLLTISIFPGILFPQFKPIPQTGSYDVETESFTLTDFNRIEKYSVTGENRKVTIQFWYPETESQNDTFPLVIFSPGAFGFRSCNYSTFVKLASNGYVVCSIDHTYQSLYTKQADGKVVIVNRGFLKDALGVNDRLLDRKDIYKRSQEWLKFRLDDMNFVLDTILEETKSDKTTSVYGKIDSTQIGLFGHSLGGAAAAQAGRERSDIDAVINLDGTMFGEQIDFVNGEPVLNHEAYPVPILNMYSQYHYNKVLKEKDSYANAVASANAINSFDLAVKNSGHLNFTDLPLFSPLLTDMLGIGEVDSRYCIETMNQIVLDFFDYTLKDSGKLHLQKEY